MLSTTWDAETGQLVKRFDGHEDTVLSVAFSPDGKYLAFVRSSTAVWGNLDLWVQPLDDGPEAEPRRLADS